MSAKYQDQFAIATKNITHRPTDVWTAQPVNSQETVTKVTKIIDAKPLLKTVTQEDKFNLDSNNASDAKHAQLDKTLSETSAESQDHNVIAINNTMLRPTDVTPAQ
jgi:hypothetical protein